MCPLKVHIIHVGHMANKGTQALLMTDVAILRGITHNEVVISVSTTDVDGVRRLNAPIDSVLPTTVDIPYERADIYAKRQGLARSSLRYKLFALASLFYMFEQIGLSAISAIMVKAGLGSGYRSSVFARLNDCDVVVTCSDENFKESASLLPPNVYWILTWWSMLTAKTWEVVLAKLLRKRVVMFPNSVGPFRTAIGRFLSKVALSNYDSILVREPVSYDIVRSLGIRSNVILTSDTALLFDPANSSQTGERAQLCVGVSPGIYAKSLSEKKIHEYVSIHAKALDTAIEKYGFSVVFLPHYVRGFPYDDLEICRLIMDGMKNSERTKLIEASNLTEFKSWINKMDMIVSSKMHPAVFAVSSYIPAVFVAYDHKQTGFAETIGLGDCIVPLNELSYERLLTKVEFVWNKRTGVSKRLRSRVPKLKKSIEDSIASVITQYIKTN